MSADEQYAWWPEAQVIEVSRTEVIEACYAPVDRRFLRVADLRTRVLFAQAASGRPLAILLHLEPVAAKRTWWIIFARPMTETEEQTWRSLISPR